MEIIKKETKNGIKILKYVLLALLISLIGILIFSVLLSYTNISENYINPVTTAITSLSIFIGSLLISRKTKKTGLINGLLVSSIYILIIYLISSILNWNFSINLQSIIFIIVNILCGLVGGIIGVNLKF